MANRELDRFIEQAKAAGFSGDQLEAVIKKKRAAIRRRGDVQRLGDIERGLTRPSLPGRFFKRAAESFTSPLSLVGLNYSPDISDPIGIPEKVAGALGSITGTVASFLPISAVVGGARVAILGGKAAKVAAAAGKSAPFALRASGRLGNNAKYVKFIDDLARKSPRIAQAADMGISNLLTFNIHGQLSLPMPTAVEDRISSIGTDSLTATMFTGVGLLGQFGKAGKVAEPLGLFGVGAFGDLGRSEMTPEDRVIHGLSLVGFHYFRQGMERIGREKKMINALITLGYSPKEAFKIAGDASPKIETAIANTVEKIPQLNVFALNADPTRTFNIEKAGTRGSGENRRAVVEFRETGDVKLIEPDIQILPLERFKDLYSRVEDLKEPITAGSEKKRGGVKKLQRLNKLTNDEHGAISTMVTGKESTTIMDNRDLDKMLAVYGGPSDKRINIGKGQLGYSDVFDRIVARMPSFIQKRFGVARLAFEKVRNATLPMNRVLESMRGEVSSIVAGKLVQLTRLSQEIAGSFSTLKRELGKTFTSSKGIKFKLSKKQIEGLTGHYEPLLDYSMPASVRDIFESKNPNIKEFASHIDKVHNRIMNQEYNRMLDVGMEITTIKDGKVIKEPMGDKHRVSSFVHRQLTKDYAEKAGFEGSRINEDSIADIRKIRGISYEEALDLISNATKWRSGKSVGRQYSRIADLDPVMAYDAKGNRIDLGENYGVKKGDVIDGAKIDDLIKVYETNYLESQAVYFSRLANQIPAVTFFTNDPAREIEKITIGAGDKTILKQAGRREATWAKDAMESVIIGTGYDEATARAARAIVGFTASAGLSGPVSFLKNIVTGQTQIVGTFGFKNMTSGMWESMRDKKIWNKALEDIRSIGAVEVGEKLISTTIGKNRNPLTFLSRTWMEPSEFTNRLVSIIVGPYAARNAIRVLKNQISPLQAGMNKAEAIRLLKDTFGLDVPALVKRGRIDLSPAELKRVQQISHEITQGNPAPIFMPKWLGGRLGSAGSLFYRIAFRVTENVHRNILTPLVVDGNATPMMRYVAATTASGAGLIAAYNAILGRDRDEFKNSAELLWEDFIRAEGLAIFSNAFDDFGSTFNSYTPVIVRPITGLANNVGNIIMGKKTFGSGLKDFTKDNIVIWKNVMNIYTRTAEPNIAEFKAVRKIQRSFESKILKKPRDTVEIKPSTKTPYYRAIREAFYSDASSEDKGRMYWAAVNYLAHQLVIAGAGRYRNLNAAKVQARGLLKGVITNLQPVTLSSERRKGEKFSRRRQFLKSIKPESRLRIKALEKTYIQKRREFLRAVAETRGKYGNVAI